MKNRNMFWTSYADLMTNLFFVILLLLVVVFSTSDTCEKEKVILKEDLETSRKDLFAANQRVSGLEFDLAESTAALDTANLRITQLESDILRYSADISDKDTALAELNALIASLRYSLAESTTTLAATGLELSQTKKTLGEKESSLSSALADLASLRISFEKSENDLKQARLSLSDTEGKLKKSEAQLKVSADTLLALRGQYERMEEIQKSGEIKSDLFTYSKEYKKHVLTIDVKFKPKESDVETNTDEATRKKLIKSGQEVRNHINAMYKKFGIPFLIIIEGQASKDNYDKNWQLSYERALSLLTLWEKNGINLRSKDYNKKCEVIVAGSGTGGVMRDPVNEKNQRFLIHILPKPGYAEAERQSAIQKIMAVLKK